MAINGSFNTSSCEDRYLIFNWWRNSYSIEDNSTTIGWELVGAGCSGYVTCGAFTVVIDGTTVYSTSTSDSDRVKVYVDTVVASGTKTIYHNSDGSRSFSASVSAGIYYYNPNCSGQGSWVLENIPRQATIITAPNFNDEENPTIKYSNPAGGAVTTLQACISLEGSKDDIAYRDISKTGSSYTFNLTNAERELLRRATLSGKTSRTVKFYIKTIIGGATLSHNVPKTFTVIKCDPTLNPDVEDVNTASIDLTGDSNKIIKGYNTVNAISGAAALKGASITSQSITCGSEVITSSSGVFNNVENPTFIFSVTDNRGLTTTKTVTKELIDYVKLTCSMQISPPDAEGDLSFSIYGNYFDSSFGAVYNELAVQYRYKPVNEDWEYYGWIDVYPSTNGNTYDAQIDIRGLDYTSTYVFQARAADKVYTEYITTPEYTVKTMPVFDWGKDDFNFNVPVHVKGAITNDIPVVHTNADTMLTSGTYYLGSDSTNKPVSDNGWLEVFSYNKGEQCHQKFTSYTGKHYERFRSNGSWDSWTSDLLKAYPINSIYISYSHTSPASLFGGTWTRVIHTSTGAGAFLYGCTAAAVIGEEGGEAAHTLTENEMPKHKHNWDGYGVFHELTNATSILSYGSAYPNLPGFYEGSDWSSNGYVLMKETGGGAAHNNIPPFVKVSIWRRIA